jgi:hypothetical protein
VAVPSGPIQVIGLRGGRLLEAIRIHYGWELEDLQRQLEHTLNRIYALNTISTWESNNKISWPAAEALGFLFKLDAELFCCYSEKTCQSWTPPLFQKQERPSSESVQQILDSVRKRFQQGLPDDLVGLRGGSLLRKIRIAYLGWEREELKRQIERVEHKIFAVTTISVWESSGSVSVPGARVLGSFFGIDLGLFNPRAGTNRVHGFKGVSQYLQESTPPSQTQESSPVPVGPPHCESLEGEAPDPFAFSPGDDLFAGFDL